MKSLMISLRKDLVVMRFSAPQMRLTVHAVEFGVRSWHLSSQAGKGRPRTHTGPMRAGPQQPAWGKSRTPPKRVLKHVCALHRARCVPAPRSPSLRKAMQENEGVSGPWLPCSSALVQPARKATAKTLVRGQAGLAVVQQKGAGLGCDFSFPVCFSLAQKHTNNPEKHSAGNTAMSKGRVKPFSVFLMKSMFYLLVQNLYFTQDKWQNITENIYDVS